ncbi:hypothetical protein Tco_1375415 [Tanacetum coccineum]
MPNPLPAIIQRVSVLEKDVQKLKEVDHTKIHLALLRSEIPSVVNAYLGSSLEDALQKSVQANIINEVKNLLPKFLPKAVSDFSTLVIQSTVKTPTILAQSSSQAQSSLKKILRKRDHDGDDKDEDPSAGPNQGKKTKRRRTKESETYKKTSTTKETSKSNASTKGSKSDKSVHVEELVAEPTKEVIMHASNDDVVNDADQPKNDLVPKHNWFTQHPRPPTLDPEWNKGKAIDDSRPGRLTVPLDYFFNNDLEYLKSSDPEKKYTTSITKMKAARYEKGQQIARVKDVYLDDIMEKALNRQLYKFKEGDFVNLHLNDIEDMLLFIVQHKLFQLDGSDIFDLAVALRVVYEYLNKKKRVMQIDELYKFLDRTLKLVCDELHHRILNFRLGYNKEISRRKWSATDKRGQIHGESALRMKLLPRMCKTLSNIDAHMQGSNFGKENIKTKTKLTLEQTQQGVSDEVLVSIEGVEE